jgi:hypothetical protein
MDATPSFYSTVQIASGISATPAGREIVKRIAFVLSLSLVACLVLASCKADADIDATFHTTVNVHRGDNPAVFENRIKFTLIDKIRPSLEKFGIVPEDVSIDGFEITPDLTGIPTDVRDISTDVLVYIELVKSESDITTENRTLLCAGYSKTLGQIGGLQASSDGIALLKEIMGHQTDVRHVLLTYQLLVDSEPPASVSSIDLEFKVKAAMSKHYEDIL